MAMKYWEAFESGNGSLGRESEDTYAIIIQGEDPLVTGNPDDGSDDAGKVMLFALGKFSAVTPNGNIIERFDREKIGPRLWKITGIYRSRTQTRPTNDNAFSFCTTGGTQHVTHSRRTVGSYAPSDADSGTQIPDFKGAIGVSGDSVSGTDIQVPVFNFKVTQYIQPSQLGSAYVAKLYKATGTVNQGSLNLNVDGVLMRFDEGEALFMGAEGSKRVGFGDWELTMEWAASPNLVKETVGPFENVDKNGWDYLWVYYNTDADPSANQLVQKPVALYVEQVYAYYPHSLIAVNFSQTPPGSELVWDSNGVLIIPGGGLVGAV
jgi:hypothetical protein